MFFFYDYAIFNIFFAKYVAYSQELDEINLSKRMLISIIMFNFVCPTAKVDNLCSKPQQI